MLSITEFSSYILKVMSVICKLVERRGKPLTHVHLPDDLDMIDLLKIWKMQFRCNGTIVEDEHGQFIQLQGNRLQNIVDYYHGEQIVVLDSQ